MPSGIVVYLEYISKNDQDYVYINNINDLHPKGNLWINLFTTILIKCIIKFKSYLLMLYICIIKIWTCMVSRCEGGFRSFF